MNAIHVIHENEDWVRPLRKAFAARGLAFEDWNLGERKIDLSGTPPRGVFYNRMSASAHTRGHHGAAAHTAEVLKWLERAERKVINGSRALRLEMSKEAQYVALAHHGIRIPRTVPALDRDGILNASASFIGDIANPVPFVIKPNRGGKGLGVARFDSLAELASHLDGPDFLPSPDGITLVQEYILSPDATIIRAEFVGGKFLYAVRVDTRQGFELCPADACAVDGSGSENGRDRPMFEILRGFHHPVLEQYRGFLAASGIDIAGIEFIQDAQGTPYTYDINTNTNYNPDAEAALENPLGASARLRGMDAIAGYLGRALARLPEEEVPLETMKQETEPREVEQPEARPQQPSNPITPRPPLAWVEPGVNSDPNNSKRLPHR